MATSPASNINYTESFNFNTVTNGATTVDLADTTINNNIVDSIVSTQDGRFRPYLNGKIKFESDTGYCLTHDETKKNNDLVYISHGPGTSAPSAALNTWNNQATATSHSAACVLDNCDYIGTADPDAMTRGDPQERWNPLNSRLPHVESYSAGELVTSLNHRPGLGNQTESDLEAAKILNCFDSNHAEYTGHNSY